MRLQFVVATLSDFTHIDFTHIEMLKGKDNG
jgi:hypothetical protein